MSLTSLQVAKLADTLLHTDANAAAVCNQMFAVAYVDCPEVLAKMVGRFGVYRCEECGFWRGVLAMRDEQLCRKCNRERDL